MGKVKRSLSILLAIAMIITMMPQTAMPVYAANLGMEDAPGGTPGADDLGTPSNPETGEPGGETSGEGETIPENESETPPEGDIPEDGNSEGEIIIDQDDVKPADPADSDNEINTISGTGEGDPIDMPAITTLGETVTVTFKDVTNNKGTGFTVAGPEGQGAPSNEWTTESNYVFTVTLDADYESFTAKAAGTTSGEAGITVPGEPAEGGYYACTLTADALSALEGNVEITITAVKKKYDVAVNIDGAVSSDSSKATVAWEPSTLVSDGKIEAGEDLTFKVAVKNEVTERIEKVTYQIGDPAGTEEDITDKADAETGVYTIDKEKIKGKVTINVTTHTYTSYQITFKDKNKKSEITIITNGTPAESADNSWDGEGQITKTVSEKDTITFKVNPKANSGYKVNNVHYEGQTASLPTDPENKEETVYVLGNVTEATTIVIDTAIDETKANILDLDVGNTTNKNAYTVKFYAFESESLDEGFAKESYLPGEEITTLTNKFYAVFEPKGYDFAGEALAEYLTYTTADTYTVTEETDASKITGLDDLNGKKAVLIEYLNTDYSKAINLKLTLNVKLKELELGEDGTRTILFSNQSANLTYAVDLRNSNKADGKNKNIAQGAASNTYVAKTGATELEFTVTSSNVAFTPKVTYLRSDSNTESEPLTADSSNTSKGKTTYTYTLSVSLLDEDAVIYLREDTKKQKITVEYDDADVTVTARIGAKATTFEPGLVEGTKKLITFNVPHGETITLTAKAKGNNKITSVTQTQGSSNPKTLSNKAVDSYETAIKADASKDPIVPIAIKVVSNKLYWAVLTDTTDEGDDVVDDNLANGANVTVDYNHTYELQVFQGAVTATAQNASSITSVSGELKKGNKKVETSATIATVNEGKVKLDFSKDTTNAPGNKLVVDLYAGTSTDKIATYTFNVRPKLKKVEVVDPSNAKKTTTEVNQAAGTTQEYTLKLDPANANPEVLKVDNAQELTSAGFTVDLDTDDLILTVTTPPTPDKTGTVKISGGENTASLKVNSIDQLAGDTNKQPTLKLADADDKSLTLTMGKKKGVEIKGDYVYYAVHIKPVDNGKVDKETNNEELAKKSAIKALTADGTTFYVPTQEGRTEETKPFTVMAKPDDYPEDGDDWTGDAWKYIVSVQFVQASKELTDDIIKSDGVTKTVEQLQNEDKNKGDSEKVLLAVGWPIDTDQKPLQTKRPYYEDKLKLTKKNTTIYTTQGVGAINDNSTPDVDESNGVLIATAAFSAKTTYKELDYAVDTNYGTSSKEIESQANVRNGSLELKVVGDKIYAIAHKSKFGRAGGEDADYTDTGKHKITVYAVAADGMQQASATIDVTVVQGIEDLEVTVPSTSIYKVNNKASSLTPTVVYNNKDGDVKTYAPKTKKVTWTVEAKDETSDLEDYLTINQKNGSVTVKKEYVVLPAGDDNVDNIKNQFRIVATAADYTGKNGNKISKASDWITITDEPQQIGEVVLATAQDAQGVAEEGAETATTYTVLARNTNPRTSKTAEELKGAQLFVLKKGTPAKGTFTSEDILENSCFTFSASNKAVTLTKGADYSQTISVSKPVNNVKFTATANDGSKQKSVLTIDIGHTKVAANGGLTLQIEGKTPYLPEAKTATLKGDGDKFVFDGTMGSILDIEVLKKDGDGWATITDYTDFKISAKNAKLLPTAEGTQYNNIFKFVVTKNPATITLNYKAEGETKAYTATYTITNNGYSVSNKAPKFTLKDTLISGEWEAPQTLTPAITAPKGMTVKDLKGKQVKVEVDLSGANANTLKNYLLLDEYLKSDAENLVYTVNEEGKFKITLGAQGGTNIPAGTYKLKATLGTWSYKLASGTTFEPEYQAASISVKAGAAKVTKGAFKLATKYTLSAFDREVAFNTAGSKELSSVNYTELLNANVAGNENKFTEYFEFTDDQKGIRINPAKLSLDQNGKITLDGISKDDYTGYLTYTAQYGKDLLGNYVTEVTATVKLTITFKDAKAASYAVANKPTVLSDRDNVKAYISINTNKEAKPIAYAAAEYNSASKVKDDAFKTKDDLSNCEIVKADGKNTNEIMLTSQTKPEEGEHKIDLYIVPDDSALAAHIDGLQEDSDTSSGKTKEQKQLDAIKSYGIKLTATINVKKSDDASYSKISMPNTVVFNNDHYLKDGNGNYREEVAYTLNGDYKISEVTLDETGKLGDAISFTLDEDNPGKLIVDLNKEKLQALTAAKTVSYGQKKVPAKVTMKFAPTGLDSGTNVVYRDETINFQVTLPKAASTESYQTFDEILTDINNHEKTIMAINMPEPTEWQYLSDNPEEGETHSALQKELNKIQWQIINNVRKYIPAESNVDIVVEADETVENYNKHVAYQPATATENGAGEGHVTVTLTLKDFAAEDTSTLDEQPGTAPKTSETLTYAFTIEAMGYTPDHSALATAIDTALGKVNTEGCLLLTNYTTATDILDYLKEDEAVKGFLGDNLKLYAEGFKIDEKATDNNATGKISITIIIRDVKYPVANADKETRIIYSDNGGSGAKASLTIPKLDDIAATKVNIAAALSKEKFTATNYTTQDEINAVIDKAITNKDITYDKDWEMTLSKAGETAGSITGEITLSNENSAKEDASDTYAINLEIAALLSPETIISKVAAAVIQNNLETPAESDNTIIKLAKTASASDTNTIKAKIVELANAEIVGQPYEVQIKSFSFNAATWKDPGKISFTLKIGDKGTLKNVWTNIDERLTQKEYPLPERSELQTLAEAKKQVEGEINSNIKWEEKVLNTFDRADAWSMVMRTLQDCISNKDNIKVEVKVLKFVQATFKDGMVMEFQWRLTDKDGENPTAYSKTIKVEAGYVEDLAKAKAAVEEAAAKVTVTPKEVEEEDASKIVTEAQKAVGSHYKVQADTSDEGKLKATTPANYNAYGVATLKLQVALAAEAPQWESTELITCKIDMIATQSADQAYDEVAKVLETFKISTSDIQGKNDHEEMEPIVQAKLEEALEDCLKPSYKVVVDLTDYTSGEKKIKGTLTITDSNGGSLSFGEGKTHPIELNISVDE